MAGYLHDDPLDSGRGDDFDLTTTSTASLSGILDAPWNHFLEFFVQHTGEGASLSKFTLILSPVSDVPDGASTLMLLGLALGALGIAGRKMGL